MPAGSQRYEIAKADPYLWQAGLTVRKRRDRVRDDSVLEEDGVGDVEAFAETRDANCAGSEL